MTPNMKTSDEKPSDQMDLRVQRPNHRIPKGSLKLQFAGELVLVRCPDRDLSGIFRRYAALLEAFANLEKSERILNYKFLNALTLTSHAKKAEKPHEKKKLFDLKNEIYLSIANSMESRRKVAFRYLTAKKFRVTKFCEDCCKRNTDEGLKRHAWKFCKECEIDNDFYNVLSMHHKFDNGFATLFLSNDLIPKLKNINLNNKGKLEDTKEEAVFQHYHYNVKNLDVFDLETVLEWTDKLLKD